MQRKKGFQPRLPELADSKIAIDAINEKSPSLRIIRKIFTLLGSLGFLFIIQLKIFGFILSIKLMAHLPNLYFQIISMIKYGLFNSRNYSFEWQKLIFMKVSFCILLLISYFTQFKWAPFNFSYVSSFLLYHLICF